MKKITQFFLILCLLLGMIPVVHAQSDTCDPNADYETIANAQFDAGDLEGALATSLCWVQIAPEENFALQSLGNAYRQLGDYEESLIYFNKALELYPGDPYALSSRADSYFFLGEYGLCIDDSLASLDAMPEYAYARETLVACYYWYGEDALAVEQAEMLISTDEQTAFSEMYRAGALFYIGEDMEEALSVVDGAIAMDDSYAFAHMMRARILSNMERDQEALDAINVALEINPEYALGYAVRADIYKWLGEYDLSIADIEKSLEIRPDNLFALESNVLTNYYFDYYIDAIAAAEYLLTIDPDNTFILDELAESYRTLGFCAEAIATAEKGLKIDPDWWFMTRVKGNCQVASGDSQAGIDTINTIAEENVENIPFNYNTMLRGYLQLGDYASAVTMGEISTNDDPEQPYSWRLYGIALLENGDIEAASAAFDQYRATQTNEDAQALPIAYQDYMMYLMGVTDVDSLWFDFNEAAGVLTDTGEIAPLDTPTIIELGQNVGVYYTLEAVAGDSFTIAANDADELYYVDPVVVVFSPDGFIVAVGDFGEAFSDVLMSFTAETDGAYGIGIFADGYNHGTVEFTISAE
ncbi:MAG: tetratricopeptide repeat protein [bacterium]|nr:tetratricopeptide repeat protein [bacterium]